MSHLRQQVRIEQTIRQADQLREELGEWLDRRREKDPRQQYHTQLKSLESVLRRALDKVTAAIRGVSAEGSVATVYARTRDLEKRLLLVRRLWRFFRDKFDQRDDPRLQPVLAAADEIVWSCYIAPFRNAPDSDALAPPVVPLPYVEPQYSPQAIPRMEVPGDLQSRFFKDVLYNLPFGVVSLPPDCIHSPWWLIFLGHETGHHVEFDLLPKKRLVIRFRELLQDALNAKDPADEEALKRWTPWDKEIFADLFSVLSMGPWAAAALTELALTDDKGMVSDQQATYPAPAVRLALLQDVVGALELEQADTLRGFEPERLEEYAKVAADRELARQVAAALVQQAVGTVGKLTQLCDWQADDYAEGGRVDEWKRGFLGETNLFPEETLSAARLAISGALAAWLRVADIEDEAQREEGRQALAKHVLEVVPECREAGLRSAPEEAADVEGLADLFADGLLHADFDEGML